MAKYKLTKFTTMTEKNQQREITRYEQERVFETLNSINCNEHTEKKGNLTYLSWAWAWQIVKKHFPTATQCVKTWIDENGRERNYNTYDNGSGGYVEVTVSIYEMRITEQLPIMDNRNNPIPTDKLTPFVVNTAIKRCLAKAIAMHGLGLYIYAGEDIPQVEADDIKAKEEEAIKAKIANAIKEVEACKTMDELRANYEKNVAIRGNADYQKAKEAKKKELAKPLAPLPKMVPITKEQKTTNSNTTQK